MICVSADERQHCCVHNSRGERSEVRLIMTEVLSAPLTAARLDSVSEEEKSEAAAVNGLVLMQLFIQRFHSATHTHSLLLSS